MADHDTSSRRNACGTEGHRSPKWTSAWVGGALALLVAATIRAGVDPDTGDFSYGGMGGVDDSLGRIALYLMDQDVMEGSAYVSEEAEEGIVGFQLRYADDGNQLVDERDWFSVRRYTIPAVPDTNLAAGYWKEKYIELVDTGLDGLDGRDYYFIKGKRFDLNRESGEILKQYQVQMETGVSTYIRNVGYGTITGETGAAGQTGIRKQVAFEDGSLPASMVLGLDMGYVFRPIVGPTAPVDAAGMALEIRSTLGWVFSATLTFTDVQGYQLRDLSTEYQLIQRTYDPMERQLLKLVIDSLFDKDGDGVVTPEDLISGYNRFTEIHQQLSEAVRAENRRVILPNEKLARLRKEYEVVQGKAFGY